MIRKLYRAVLTLAVGGILVVAPCASRADVTVNWAQVGANVRATFGGTISLTGAPSGDERYDDASVGTNFFSMTFETDGLLTAAGTGTPSGISSFNATSSGGNSFLYRSNAVFWDDSAEGEISGWMQFDGETLLGMNAANYNNMKVFESSDQSFAVFYNTIPEPGSIAMIAAGALGLGALLRKRRASI